MPNISRESLLCIFSTDCLYSQVLNEEKAIEECLRYLKGLALPPYQIIVVDGGSSDRSEMVFSVSSRGSLNRN